MECSRKEEKHMINPFIVAALIGLAGRAVAVVIRKTK